MKHVLSLNSIVAYKSNGYAPSCNKLAHPLNTHYFLALPQASGSALVPAKTWA